MKAFRPLFICRTSKPCRAALILNSLKKLAQPSEPSRNMQSAVCLFFLLWCHFFPTGMKVHWEPIHEGNVCVCAIDSCHPKPRSIATSASKLFSYVECTENASDVCVSALCCGTFSKLLLFFSKCYNKLCFFVVGKKITSLTTHFHVSPYCAIIFSFLFSLLRNKDREKRCVLRNSVTSTPLLC